MKFKLLGTEIYVSFLFVAIISLMLAFDKTGLALPTLISVAAHELGHLCVMWMLESTPKSIRLIPASVQITRDFSYCYKNDILIALSGPAVNLLLFFVFYINYLTFKNYGVFCYAIINLIVCLFNLLPVTGLDGGTVLFSLIAKRGDVNRAMLTLRIITLILASATLFLAITLTLRGKLNISVYIVAIYLFMSQILKYS